MTKPVDPKKSRNYIIKAENSLRIAKIAIEHNAYDNAVMTAIHSAINALDALTSSEKGLGPQVNTMRFSHFSRAF
ncbi:MAG TPA: hypothetical protein VGA92_07785 [Candidatus Nitrosotenuis sp.]|jgi:uncharacterized protein (UPF0332 family)